MLNARGKGLNGVAGLQEHLLGQYHFGRYFALWMLVETLLGVFDYRL